MRYVGTVIVALMTSLSIAAQPPVPSQPPDAQDAPPTPVARMYAVHARGAVPERLDIADELRPIAPLLRELPYTSFRPIAIHEKEMPWGEPTLFPINAVYSMRVTPMSIDEEGIIHLQAYIEMLQTDGTFLRALDTAASAAQNRALLYRGMPLGADELLVALLVSLPSDGSGDDDMEQDADPEPAETDDAEPEPPGDPDDESMEEGDAEAALEDEAHLDELDEDDELPEGRESLEALLQSLEDVDRREQIEERNRRNRIDFKGDWW